MNDDMLEDELSKQAGEQSPVFSPALHEQIMRRIKNAPIAESHPRWWNRAVMPAGIAAVVLIAAGMWIHVHRISAIRISPRPEMAIRTVPSVPAISNPVRALDGPVVTEWTTARYAYLDRDGEKLLGYVGRQLDFMPTKR